jgi:alkylation response protein AidB-like acyl-CoA dehydrogenase
MNYDITKEQAATRFRMKGDFLRAVAPNRDLLEKNRSRRAVLIRENVNALGRIGFLDLLLEGDPVTCCVAGEDLAGACPATFLAAAVSVAGFGVPLQRFGTVAQKEAWLPGLRRGEFLGAAVCGGSMAVSGIVGNVPKAERGKDGWVLRGSEPFVIGAPAADAFLVLAETGPENGATFFILNRRAKGLRIGKPVELLGLRGLPAAGIEMRDCFAPPDAVLGKEGSGREQLEAVTENLLLAASVLSLGVGTSCLDVTREYAKRKTAFGKPLGLLEDVGARLATMFTMNDIGRLLVQRAAWGMAAGDPEHGLLVACARLFTGESVEKIADLGMQVRTTGGDIGEEGIERCFRDARIAGTVFGSTGALRSQIAGGSLDRHGKP